MSPALSTALDGARALASFYVPFHHLAETLKWGGAAALAFHFGQEVVMAFFLLSGFLIFANEQHRTIAFKGYALRRIRRIYPTLLVAFAVSVVVTAWTGRQTNLFSWAQLLGNLVGWQDVAALKPGVTVRPFMGNAPLWSLSYEMAFYVIFPVALWVWRRNPPLATHGIGALSAISYAFYMEIPGHIALVLAYFQIWWLGAMIASAYGGGKRDVRAILAPVFWTVALLAVSFIPVVRGQGAGPGVYPILMVRHFVVALAATVLLFSPLGRSCVRFLAKGKKLFVPFVSISYGVYLLHYPLLIQSRAGSHPLPFGVACVALIVLAWLADPVLARLLPRVPRDW